MSIDAELLMRIRSLELRARYVVHGSAAGGNRSRAHGFSVEFTEHRPYDAGGDLRFLDWKLLARTDRAFVKQFEDETNLRAMLVVDLSRSMGFGSLPYTKESYARTLAATLAYFLSGQRDAVGVATFDDELRELVPSRFRPGHLRRLLTHLEAPAAGRATNLRRPLEQLAARLTRRTVVILFSDFLAPLDEVDTALKALALSGHEVLGFQILDPEELTWSDRKAAFWEDLESGRRLYVEPLTAFEDYRKRLDQHLERVARMFQDLGADFLRMTTRDDPSEVISAWLHRRSRDRKLLKRR